MLIGCWRSLVNDYLAAYPDLWLGVSGSDNVAKCFIKREKVMKFWMRIFIPMINGPNSPVASHKKINIL